MPFVITNLQKSHLTPLIKCETQDVIVLCKVAFDYLSNGPKSQQHVCSALADKYKQHFQEQDLQHVVECLLSLLIEATKANVDIESVKKPLVAIGFKDDTVNVLSQFLNSKRNFVEGSIKTANIRAYRLVNLEWRLEVRLASRALMKQSQVFVTMKLYLHTEPKNENRDLLEEPQHSEYKQIHEDERRNRKDLLIQTDINSLKHMILSLEEALMESRSRRIRNIVSAIN